MCGNLHIYQCDTIAIKVFFAFRYIVPQFDMLGCLVALNYMPNYKGLQQYYNSPCTIKHNLDLVSIVFTGLNTLTNITENLNSK